MASGIVGTTTSLSPDCYCKSSFFFRLAMKPPFSPSFSFFASSIDIEAAGSSGADLSPETFDLKLANLSERAAEIELDFLSDLSSSSF